MDYFFSLPRGEECQEQTQEPRPWNTHPGECRTRWDLSCQARATLKSSRNADELGRATFF